MPRLKKIMPLYQVLATVALVALVPMPAWGQSAAPDDQDQIFDRSEDPDEEAVEPGRLRGGFELELDGTDDNDRGNRRGKNDLRGSADRETSSDAAGDRLDGRGDPLDTQSRAPQQPRSEGIIEEEILDLDRENDPYAALGMRLGSFLLFPELNAESIYADNIFLTSTDPDGDWALELTPSLRIQSDWSRHSLAATLSGVRSYYERFSSEDDETLTAELAGRLDIRRQTNLVAETNYSQFFEDRSATDFPDNAATRAKVRNRDASLEGNHTFNRVKLTLRGEVSQEDYGDSATSEGLNINNDDRDFTEKRVTGRVSYEFQPGVSAFFEASANDRDFALSVDDDGTPSGSSGHDVQGGLSFQLSGKLTGEASAGYAIQKPDASSLENVDGLIFNAGLEWRATGLTTVRLEASSEVAETTQAASAGSIVRAAEISVEHRPRRHIIVGASLGYEQEEFSGSSELDEEWQAGITGEYIFTRSVALTLGYERLISLSSTPGSDYTVDEVRFGVRVRR